MNNYVLMVAAFSNEIYLGSMMKNSKLPVMNAKRRVFTDQAVRAVAEHMMNLPDHENAYVFPGHGRLVWQPEKKDEADEVKEEPK